jgi:hypothetical protein
MSIARAARVSLPCGAWLGYLCAADNTTLGVRVASLLAAMEQVSAVGDQVLRKQTGTGAIAATMSAQRFE